MAQAETRIAVQMGGNFNNKIKQGIADWQKFSRAISQSGKPLNYYSRSLQTTAKTAQETTAMISRLTYSLTRYTMIYKGLAGLSTITDTVVGGAYRYSKALETNKVGIAGILSSMTTLNGKTLEWNTAMNASGNIMKILQSEALKTAATSEELIEAFRAILGPGLDAGMKIDEMIRFVTVGTNAVKSMGLSGPQIVQELRDLVQGGIRPASSTVATSLGITDADIKKAKNSSEGLYKFLMEKMKGFEKSALVTSDTVEGRIARIKEGLIFGASKASSDAYKAYSDVLGGIADKLITINEIKDEDGKIISRNYAINKDYEKSIHSIVDMLHRGTSELADMGGKLAPIGKGLASIIGAKANIVVDNMWWFAGVAAIKVFADKGPLVGNVLFDWTKKVLGVKQACFELEQAHAQLTEQMQTMNSVTAGYSSVSNMLKAEKDSVYNLAHAWEKAGIEAQKARNQALDVFRNVHEGNFDTAEGQIAAGNRKANHLRARETAARGMLEAAADVNTEIRKNRLLKRQADLHARATEALAEYTGKSTASAKTVLAAREKLNSAVKQGLLFQNEAAEIHQKLDKAVVKGEWEKATAIGKTLEKRYEEGRLMLKNANAAKEETRITNVLAAAKKELYSKGSDGISKATRNTLTFHAAQALAKNGSKKLSDKLKELAKTYEKTRSNAKKLGYDTKELDANFNNLTSHIIKNKGVINAEELEKASKNMGVLAKNTGGWFRKIIRGTGQISAAASGIGFLATSISALSDEEDKVSETTAHWAFAISGVITALETLVPIVAKAGKAVKDLAVSYEALASAKVLALGPAAVAIGATGAAVAYGAAQKKAEYEKNGIDGLLARYYSDNEELMHYREKQKKDPTLNAVREENKGLISLETSDKVLGQKVKEFEYNAKHVLLDDLKGPKKEEEEVKKTAAAKRTAYKHSLTSLMELRRKSEMDLAKATLSRHAYTIKEIENVRVQSLQKANMMKLKVLAAGTDAEKKQAKELAAEIMRINDNLAKAKLKAENEKHSREAFRTRMEQLRSYRALHSHTTEEILAEENRALKERERVLEKMYNAERDNVDKRKALYEELTDVKMQLRKNGQYDFRDGLRQALKEYEDKMHNYKDLTKDMLSTLEDAGTEFLAGAGSLSKKLKHLSRSLANSIIQQISRVIMKGLIAKSIFAMFGGGGTSGGISMGSIIKGYTPYTGVSIGGRATGGSFSKGDYSLVGESGPELVRFNRSGSVVDAEKTKKALGNDVNIKVEIKNESGTPVKAEQDSVRFDGESYILGIVLKGFAENRYGMRNMLREA